MVTTSERPPVLSKTLDPSDLADLTLPLMVVDLHFDAASPQHPQRRWEYAMALRAATVWSALRDGAPITNALDIGGAGSPFGQMLRAWGAQAVTIVDPAASIADGVPFLATDLAYYRQSNQPRSDAVFCISVLEHVDDFEGVCGDLCAVVAPGGLLFLTVDYCDALAFWPDDTYHLHWMRKRIFGAYTLGKLSREFFLRQFSLLGGAFDYTWHGPQVYDYTFASLALRKSIFAP
jgi:SAM-dependent methyltransferase